MYEMARGREVTVSGAVWRVGRVARISRQLSVGREVEGEKGVQVARRASRVGTDGVDSDGEGGMMK